MLIQQEIVPISAQDFEYNFSFTVFPDYLNYAGTLFGGKLLAEMDLAAANTARRLLYGTECNGAVTVALDKVEFKNPAFLGDIILLNTKIIRLGNSSMDIKVDVNREQSNGQNQEICVALFTFVSLKDRKPFPHFKKLIEGED